MTTDETTGLTPPTECAGPDFWGTIQSIQGQLPEGCTATTLLPYESERIVGVLYQYPSGKVGACLWNGRRAFLKRTFDTHAQANDACTEMVEAAVLTLLATETGPTAASDLPSCPAPPVADPTPPSPPRSPSAPQPLDPPMHAEPASTIFTISAHAMGCMPSAPAHAKSHTSQRPRTTTNPPSKCRKTSSSGPAIIATGPGLTGTMAWKDNTPDARQANLPTLGACYAPGLASATTMQALPSGLHCYQLPSTGLGAGMGAETGFGLTLPAGLMQKGGLVSSGAQELLLLATPNGLVQLPQFNSSTSSYHHHAISDNESG